MKTARSISRFIWTTGILILALMALLLWTHFQHRGNPRANPESPQPAVPEAPTAAAAPAQPAAVAQTDSGSLPPVIPIPLQPVLVDAENGSWLRDKDYLLAPHQARDFGGIQFLMDGMIQLQGRTSKEYRNRNYRTTISIPITVTNAIGGLHLLGGSRYGTDRKVMAEIVWQYADGTSRRTPIELFNHIRDWVRNPYEQPAHLPYAFAKVVWAAPQPSQPDHAFRLYRVSFANPNPKQRIQALQFASTMEDPTLFVVGLTLDPLQPGLRPDNSPDLEPTDSAPASRIQIAVQNLQGQPLPQSSLQIRTQRHNGKNRSNSTSRLTTDAMGNADVMYPPEGVDRLEISASHEDYSSRMMAWSVESGDVIPASYTLKLGAEVKIGGTVVDESGAPIAGAKISLHRFWTGGDDINKKGDQADFPTQSTTSDASGSWQATGLPAELLDHIGFDVSHPDFVSTNYTVSNYEAPLRAGTFKIVLHRGLEVRGSVVDDKNNPISGATVSAGRRFFRDRQQTKSDAQGHFTFRNVSGGDVLFSVMAQGHSPDNKTVSVHPDMAEILFQLGAGNVIRAHVQDASSQPISGAQVGLEGSPGEAAYDAYEFSTKTDDQGNFVWDSAPNDTMPFYIFHDGFEAKRGVKLAPNQDNMVTLSHTRQLQGIVLDADSGEAVTNFTVRTGHQDQDGSDVYGVIRYHSFSPPDGKFTLDIDEESDNAVAVSGDDYYQKVVPFPPAQDGIIQVEVRLKRSNALQGTVTLTDGTPVPGVAVTAVGGGQSGGGVSLSGSHLRSYNSQTKVVTTDADGKFTLPSPPGSRGTVIASGDPGFGTAPVDQVRASGVVVLQSFGGIEGTLKIAGQPAAGKDLMLTLSIPNISTDWDAYRRTTDDQGAFTFEKVPPGQVSIVRLIQTAPDTWSHSHNTSVTVEPGKTTHVTLGDSGAVIQGTVRFQTPPADPTALTIGGNMYLAQQKGQPSFFALVVGPDQTFTVDSVPPGTYTLQLTATKKGQRPWSQPPLAQGQTTVTVPDDANPQVPIPVGEILLKASTQ